MRRKHCATVMARELSRKTGRLVPENVGGDYY